MADRGCRIKVQFQRELGSTSSSVEEMVLQVALHSPLVVLKQQLSEITHTTSSNQVLILLDLSDPDRNSDRLLTEQFNDHSLRNIGIQQNSVLSLHPLVGMKTLKEAQVEKELCTPQGKKIHTLCTPIPPARADHSFNGVIFNVSSKGPNEVTITSVFLAGMLSKVRVFARDQAWDAPRDSDTATFSGHWWAYRENVSKVGWKEVASQFCSPSWDNAVEIKFHTPVTLLPYETIGLYCHSALPDDLGIQYQSYNSKDAIVAEDDVIRITPGVGHTSRVPFDEVNGWYRYHRGPAGAISYSSHKKGWTHLSHKDFPLDFRASVKELLLNFLSPLLINCVLEFVHLDWFEPQSSERRNFRRSNRETSVTPVTQSSSGVVNLIGTYFTASMSYIAAGGNVYHDDDVTEDDDDDDDDDDFDIEDDFIDVAEDEDELYGVETENTDHTEDGMEEKGMIVDQIEYEEDDDDEEEEEEEEQDDGDEFEEDDGDF